MSELITETRSQPSLIIGAGGGGKGGGGSARVAQEAPDSLRSKAFARVVDLVCEGEIQGLANGLKSVYLDDTAIQNADGSYNFAGVTLETRNGTQQQSYIPGFSSVENEVAAGGATLAAVVVMLMTPPRNIREWTAGLISTVVSSICGGAITIEYFQLHHWAFSTIGLYAMGGVIFACGLPGWALVRWLFNFIDARRDEPIDEVAKDVKGLF